MSELLLVNPRRRKAKRAAPKRRTRKAVTVVRRAPVKRRRRSVAARAKTVYRNVATRVKKFRRRRKSSGSHGGMGGGFLRPLMHAVPGAVGAVAVNLILSKLPLPAVLTSGPIKHVARVGIILGLGLIANKVSRNPMIGRAVEGALTVSVYESIKELMAGAGMPLAGDMGISDGVGYYSAAQTINGYVDNPGMGTYIDNPAMGEYVSGVGEFSFSDSYPDEY